MVIDRRITQGTRSQRGDRWCERIWTVMATCGQQGRSVFEYLESAVTGGQGGIATERAESPALVHRHSADETVCNRVEYWNGDWCDAPSGPREAGGAREFKATPE